MHEDYPAWLAQQKYTSGTQTSQIHRVKKVEEFYGSLDEHYLKGTYDKVIDELQYSTADERGNKPNPSKIQFDGNIRNNLQSYKNAVVRYRRFLMGGSPIEVAEFIEPEEDVVLDGLEDKRQRLALERDMQQALRLDIKSLSSELNIIDDGAEWSVDSGFIDILCETNEAKVVVELKAGKADSRAIGQILGYMGDLSLEEDKPVKGILVAHEFDKRTKAAARAVPNLTLKRYSIAFTFEDEE